MKRRAWLAGIGVGTVAAAGGAWLAVSRQADSGGGGSVSGPPAALAPPVPSVPGDLWNLSFERPEGGVLVMRTLLGRPTLVNFWATWCPPCVKELPMLDATHRRRGERGLQVVGLAVDGPTPVRQFLARAPVEFPNGLAGLTGVELGKAMGNATGGLPFTVVYDRAGLPVDQKLGALTQEELDRWERIHSA